MTELSPAPERSSWMGYAWRAALTVLILGGLIAILGDERLPPEARAYVERLEALIGVPALLVSTGSGRDDTIVAALGQVAGAAGPTKEPVVAGAAR